LTFDKRQLKEAYKTLKIGSDWIRLDQIGSDWIKLDQTASYWIILDQIGSDWIIVYGEGSQLFRDAKMSKGNKVVLKSPERPAF
jgi:hypothetical protein